jgi:hypothetical protein
MKLLRHLIVLSTVETTFFFPVTTTVCNVVKFILHLVWLMTVCVQE